MSVVTFRDSPAGCTMGRVETKIGLEQDAGVAAVVSDTWSAPGWRSVRLREVRNAAGADLLEMPAIDDQHLIMCTGGRASVEASGDGRRWRRYEYAPGAVGMTAPGRRTLLRWRAPHRTMHLFLPGSAFVAAAAQVWHRDLDPLDLPDTIGTRDRLVESTMLAMADAAAAGADDLYAESARTVLAVHLLPFARRRYGRDDSRVRRTIEFMRDNLAAPLTLEEIAGAAGLSPYHFLRVFKAATGEPPRRYLTRIRLESARRHLSRGDLSITEIAYACGFSSSTHLAAAFRRHFGTSPSAFRALRSTTIW